MVRVILQSAWTVALCGLVGACSGRVPHVVLTVDDPDGLAVDAVEIGVGRALDNLRRETLGDALPFDVTVTFSRVGLELIWAEAYDGAGAVLGRGNSRVEFRREGGRPAVVRLAVPCGPASNEGARCTPAEPELGDGICVGSTCLVSTCGDGQLDATHGEQCDDGNVSNADDCLATCVPNVCGDGHRNPRTESCDDGNDVEDDSCTATCVANECGDEHLNPASLECFDDNQCTRDVCVWGSCQNDTLLAHDCIVAVAGDGRCALDGADAVCRLEVGRECTDGDECADEHCLCADADCTVRTCHTVACGTCQFTGAPGQCLNTPVGNRGERCTAPSSACSGLGACRLALGQACATDVDCASGHCECVDAACDAVTCSAADCDCGFNTDADAACDGNLDAGTSDPEASCGASSCDGAGGCS